MSDINSIHIVVINGYPRSGKDTFIGFVRRFCDRYDSAEVRNISSVDPIKKMLKSFGYSEDNKTEEFRLIMSLIKKEWSKSHAGPTRYLIGEVQEIASYCKGEEYIVFVQIREPDEIKYFVEMSQFLLSDMYDATLCTLFINRNDAEKNHINNSDKFVNEYEYDITIDNNGSTEDLKGKAEEFVCDILNYSIGGKKND